MKRPKIRKSEGPEHAIQRRLKKQPMKNFKRLPRKPKRFKLTQADICRFHSYVARSTSNKCWNYLRGCGSSGYGNFKIKNRTLSAHRVAFQIALGPPKGYVCHSCDNKKCCNPAHLYDGDNLTNMQDCNERNRPRGQAAGKTILTDEQVLKIAKLKRQGLGYVAVCEKMQLPRSRVGNVFYGFSWQHLTKIKRYEKTKNSGHPRTRIQDTK